MTKFRAARLWRLFPLSIRRALAGSALLGATLGWPGTKLALAADNTFVVNSTLDDGSPGTLRWAIGQANSAGPGVQTISIQFGSSETISLASDLPMLDNSTGAIVIENGGSQQVTIDGQDANQVFFVATGNVSISDLAIINGASQGGEGGAGPGGGGGGLGAGGALFVNSGASVVIENVQFEGNSAKGGNGGEQNFNLGIGGGGGGGYTGAGGNGGLSETAGGGGGGGFAGAGAVGGPGGGGGGGGGISGVGGAGATGGGGGGGTTAGNAATNNGGDGNAGALGGNVGTSSNTAAPAGDGGEGQSPLTAGAGGGGEGGANTGSGTAGGGGNGGNGGVGGGGGGGGAAGIANSNPAANGGSGGNGGTYGGGGGGGGATFGSSNGGSGGDFGGGGGAGVITDVIGRGNAGNGGFGGGGGGASASGGEQGQGGFGGGNGGARFDGGDGGDGYGGAIFVRQGGSLTVVGSSTANNAVTPGTGGIISGIGNSHGQSGQTAGQDLYLMSGVNATFNQAASSFTGSISGEGGITVQSPGTTFLSGANDYTGGTTVSGTANLQGTTTSIQGAITNDSSVTLDQSFNGTYSGNMSGAGSLFLIGTGTITMSGNANSVAATEVQNGGLLVNGSLTSDVLVNAGTLLGGSGTIHGSATVDGNTAPGNSIGTLTVDGGYTQNAGSTLTIEVNSSGHTPGVHNDLLAVDSATLAGGTVVVDAAAGTYTGSPYRFLRSDTAIQGQFAGITDNLSDYNALLFYDFFDDYYWAYFSLQPTHPDYAQFAATPNEIAVADYLDSIYGNPDPALEDMFIGLNMLYNNAEEMRSAFNAMSDQVSPTMAQVGIQNTTLVTQQLAGQLRNGSILTEPAYAKAGAAPVSQSRSPVMLVSYDKRSATPQVTFVSQENRDCWQGWSFGYGLGGSAKTDGNAAGLNYGMGGMLLGAERYFDQAGRVGFFGGYQGTSLQLNGLTQSGRINGGMFGGYFHNDDGFHYYTAITGMQFNGYDTTRNIQFDGISETARGNFSGWQGYGYLERGVSFRRDYATLQPYAALQYIYLRQNNYTETGAGVLNLDVSGIDANSLRSLVGSRVQLDGEWRGGRFLPEVRALWLHEFLDTESTVNSFFAPIGGGSFAIQGLNLGRDWAIVGGGVRYELASGWQLYGNYDAQVNNQQVFHVGSGGLQYAW